MKKHMLMAVVLGMAGYVGSASAAVDASATFTWSGLVPAAPVSNGWIIKDAVGNDIIRGILVFKLDSQGAKGELMSSSSIDFNVYDYSNNVIGAEATSYKYELSSIKVTKGGLPQEQSANGYYAVTGDGVKMVKGATPTAKAGGITTLAVTTSGVATPDNQPDAGEPVDFHALIVVSDAVM